LKGGKWGKRGEDDERKGSMEKRKIEAERRTMVLSGVNRQVRQKRRRKVPKIRAG
jgi:hypothetical protein